MISAIQITSFDGPAAMAYGRAAEPNPGPGQVSLVVDYAGANYVEALFAEGLVPSLSLPWVPGIEAAGRVRSLGEGVTGLAAGQPVAALTINDGGAYGQVAVTNASLVAPMPMGLDPVTAAAVPSNTTTALLALERLARLAPGEAVLVQAAAGGLGSQFGQVARWLGASRVTGVVGSEGKRQAALGLGYDQVWTRDELAGQAPGQFDVIADPVSGPGRAASLDLLRLGGRLLAVGDAAQAGDQLVSTNQLWFGGKGVLGFNLGAYAAALPALVGEYLVRALDLVATGAVKVSVNGTAPIESAATVLAELRAGRTTGKTVFQHDRWQAAPPGTPVQRQFPR